MKKIIVSIAALLLPCFGLYSQNSKESWELPMENDVVYYKEATTIPVKKNELCEYFFTQTYFDELFNKLNASASEMSKTRFFKGTSSYSYSLQLNTGNEAGYLKLDYCNPEENDTIYGRVEYELDWSSWVITNGSHATKNTKVSFFITIIFMNTEDIFVSLKGLSIKQDEYKAGINKGKHKDEYLAEEYQKFIAQKKKSKEDKELFSKINELSNTFYRTLFSYLKMQVHLLGE